MMNDPYEISTFFAPLLAFLLIATAAEFVSLRRRIRPNPWLPIFAGIITYFSLYWTCWTTTLQPHPFGVDHWNSYLQHETQRNILLFWLFFRMKVLLMLPVLTLCGVRIISDRRETGITLATFRMGSFIGLCFLYFRMFRWVLKVMEMIGNNV